jgi:hypothetical protein
MQDGSNSTTLEKSSENVGDGLTKIGDYTICTHGLAAPYRGPRRPVQREQVEIVKEFLQPFRRMRWARDGLSPRSSDLKHWIENWAGRYISNGAVIVAASHWGFVCAPYHDSNVALIGVHFDDVIARMAEGGWHWNATSYWFGRSKPRELPEPDPAFFAKWAKENGINTGDDSNIADAVSDDDDPFAVKQPEPHPFWAQLEQHGIRIGADGSEGR